jgi:hypothetical protein
MSTFCFKIHSATIISCLIVVELRGMDLHRNTFSGNDCSSVIQSLIVLKARIEDETNKITSCCVFLQGDTTPISACSVAMDTAVIDLHIRTCCLNMNSSTSIDSRIGLKEAGVDLHICIFCIDCTAINSRVGLKGTGVDLDICSVCIDCTALSGLPPRQGAPLDCEGGTTANAIEKPALIGSVQCGTVALHYDSHPAEVTGSMCIVWTRTKELQCLVACNHVLHTRSANKKDERQDENVSAA